MKQIKYFCPECKTIAGLDRVSYDSIITSAINGVDDDGIEYGQTKICDDSTTGRYHCSHCGKLVKDGKKTIIDDEELIEYLEKVGALVD